MPAPVFTRPIVGTTVSSEADVTALNQALEGNYDNIEGHKAATNNPHSVTKAQVGLGNVDNTSDANKPISTATATALAGKAPTSHTHSIANVTGLQSALDGKAAAADGITAPERTKLSGIATGATANATDSALRDRATHTGAQAISTVTGLQSALDGKADDSAVVKLTGAQTVAGVKTFTSPPVVPDASFAIANVTGLQGALDGKALTSHTHSIANVTGLQDALDGKALTSHTHDIANVTGLQDALDAQDAAAEALQKAVGAQGVRPGRALAAFVTNSIGAPDDLTGLDQDAAISAANVAALGTCAVVTNAAKVIAPRETFGVHPGRVYVAYFVAARTADTPDPAGDMLRYGLRRLDHQAANLGFTVVQERALTVSDGIWRRAVTFSVSAPPVGSVDIQLAASTVQVRPYVESFGTQTTTAVAQIQIIDITEAASIDGALDAVALAQAVADAEAAEAAAEAAAGTATTKADEAAASAATASTIQPLPDRAAVLAALPLVAPSVVRIPWRAFADGPVIEIVRDVDGTGITDMPGWMPSGSSTLEHFGAVGDGATSDQTAYNRALAWGRPIRLLHNRRYLVTDPRNRDGVPIHGPGRIITAITGGVTQKNTYVPYLPVYNRQYAWVVKNAIQNRTHLKCLIVGDSTATNNYGLNIGDTVRDEMRNNGINVESVTNAAVGGTGWTTGASNVADILTAYGGQPDVMFIKFALNDSAKDANGNPSVTALRNAMSSNLTNLRAHVNGGYDVLTVVLVMPNTVDSNALNNGPRDKSWIEALPEVYRDAADTFQCVIYNPYVEAHNAALGVDAFMDATLVHPLPNHNYDIWGRMVREVLAPMANVPTNGLWNLGIAAKSGITAAAGLSEFQMGETWERVAFANGWPVSGVVQTHRHADNTGRQVLYDFQLAFPVTLTRNWQTAANAWTPWGGNSSAQTLALQNSWVPYGSTLSAPNAKRTPEGFVVLSGVAKDGIVTNGTLFTTLPLGYRPAQEIIVHGIRYVLDGPDLCLLRIQTSGAVTIIRNADSGYLGLDGISFFAPF